jgi:hypothetical protein
VTANPIDLVGGLTTTANVPKADVTAWAKARVAQLLADATELRNTTLAAQLGVYLKATGQIYFFDSTDTTTADDGVTCIISFDGKRFKLPAGGFILDTDGTLAANSDARVPSQKAAKTYIDGKIATVSGHGADIVSAATINLQTATGNFVHVTGSTTISAITLSDGQQRTVYFTGAPLLTNGASLVLPGGANIQAAPGDIAVFVADGGVVLCSDYSPAAGLARSIAGRTGAFTLSTGLTNSANDIRLALNNAAASFSPANPTGTSAGPVMAGLGATCHLTPVYGTRILLTFTMIVSNTAATGSTLVQMRYGTGAAPSNGAAATGTAIGSTLSSQSINANATLAITTHAIITGLTPGTAYWFDLTQQAGGGTASLQNVTCTAVEL